MAESPTTATNPDEEQIELSDEFEAVMKTLKKNRPAYNAKVTERLIELLETKESPRAKEKVLPIFKGLRYEQLALAEKSPLKRLGYIDEAKKYLEGDQMKRIEGTSIAAKMALLLQSPETKDIQTIIKELGNYSSEFEAVGHEKEAKWALVFKRMYEAGFLFNSNRPEAFAALEEAEALCLEQGNEDVARKMRSLKYHLQAKFQRSPQEARKFVEMGLREIEQTKDKHGLKRARADLLYLDALLATDSVERAEKFISAGKLYLADGGIPEQAHESLAKGYQIKVHQPELSIEEVQKYQKLAADSFEKAGLKQMAHNMRGGYYGTRAIKRGLIGGKNKWFLKDSFEAMKEFEKAGNKREFEFFMGNIALMMAKDLPSEDKIHHLEIASKLLNRHSRGSGDFATYELFLTKANTEPNEDEQRKFRKEALKYFERFIGGLEQYTLREETRPELKTLDEGKKSLLLGFQADACRLRASLVEDPTQRRGEQLKAKELLEELRDKYPKEILNASFNLGMLYIEMEEFDKAIAEFELGLMTSSSNQQLKKALAYAEGLLKKGFRRMREERELRNEFTAFLSLEVGGVPSHIEEFLPRVMNSIVKRGELFERSPRSYCKKLETELRDELLSDLYRLFPGDATSETLIGNGKTDLRVKNPIRSSDEAIGECKWWGGNMAYLEAKDQLLGYLPPRQPNGLLITFSDTKDFNSTYETAKEGIRSSADCEASSLRDFTAFGNKKFAFISRHTTNKGGSVWIYHLLFNIYPGTD